jgi:DNA polymerase
MTPLWIDTETFSECDLKKAGVYVYAAHPSTEVVLFSYALGDDAPRCWDATTGGPMPHELATALNDPDVTVIARNAGFDRVVLRGAMGIDIPISRWQCAMVMALCHALPGALADSNKALGMSVDFSKLADGHKLVMKFCKPAPKNHKVRRYTRQTSTNDWLRYMEYCNQDVSAMRHEWKLTPNMNYNAAEVALWHLDQQINDRGFQADVELAHAGAAAADVEKTVLGQRLRFLTNEIVDGPTKREALLAYLNAVFKLDLPDLTKDTLEQRLKQGGLDPVCREIMEVRLAANKTSTAKYAALVTALGDDGRFRGGLQFAGAARTRRFAGRIFQPQNLPSRGLPPAARIEGYIAALKARTHDLIYDDLMLLGAASLRGLVVAPKGKKLVVADLSNIEGRILAWVAGEGWKLNAFREYDAGTGPDLYNITATSIIGGDPWKVSKTNRNVFGKVPDLASGYRGGVPGYQTFAQAYNVRMADYWPTIQANIAEAHVLRAQDSVSQPWAIAQINSLDISELEWIACETVKLAWRARHPATVQFWKDIQEAAIAATRNPGTVYPCGRLQVLARNSKAGHLWLYIKLPSGKYLTYFEPRVSPGDYGDSLTYMTLASEDGKTSSRAWCRTYTHGGKLTGNVCQTLAGDLLKENMPAIEAAGYQIVLSVHDEIVAEAPDTPEYNADHLSALLATNPDWADGLPLAAAGFETYRYAKQ